MVIQRIQTLFLLLAIACIATFLFIPFGYWDIEVQKTTAEIIDLKGVSIAALLVPSIIALLITFIAVFCFKRMPLQKGLVALSAIVVLAIMCVVIYIMISGFNILNPAISVAPLWGGGGLLLIGAFVALIAAYVAIGRDQKLLRSYDRMR
ncbi:MAG: DUF4293 domain-containing protein [Bacteroides sp.]|nr:DUF4293 domain-containing protein [Bacteroides sp.]MCM1414102.1 DUF4293 domain-containing protein [Bacteroides sp.]MCM1472366.1 DUF4293 domain-containing protein [Bacteroides sp.]